MSEQTDSNGTARAYAPFSSSSSSSSTASPTHPTTLVSGAGGGLEEKLCSRGVVPANAQALVEGFPAERIERAIAYFDALPDGGPGLLVRAVREGRTPTRSRRSVVAAQGEYERRIVAWLRQHFPDLCSPSPHPGAVVAVIRLHHRDGRENVNGRELRELVKHWEQRLEVTV